MSRFTLFVFARTSSGGCRGPHANVALLALCALALFLSSLVAAAQSASTSATVSVPPSAPKKNQPLPRTDTKPAWQDLTPIQQSSLRPLAANWDSLREVQKRKWIALALNYPRMNPSEQAKLHSRMTEWASLSQQQREQARLNFAESKQLTPSQKTANWQAYQALSPEERQKLAAKGAHKPAGAAAAAKPATLQKLAPVPGSAPTLKAATKMATGAKTINRNTLLPAPQPGGESESVPKN